MKLLIASWGDFERWKETKYRFGDEKLSNASTLPILQKVIEPDWTVVVLPDTLGRNFSSYEDLKEDITGRIGSFFEHIGVGREVDVLIVPGVGTFPNGSFQGSALDVYYTALYYFSTVVPSNEPLEVHFDSTHGLNYITFLIYRALKDILGIAALRNPVRFKAYNSDPYVPNLGRELSINVIEEAMIEPHPLSEPLPGKKEYILNHGMEWGDYGKALSGLKHLNRIIKSLKLYNIWIASLIHGLPLAFASYYPDGEEVNGAIEEIFELYSRAVEVGEREVKRKLALGPGFGGLVKLSFQLKVTEDLPKGREMSFEGLMDITHALFRGRAKFSTEEELHRLSRAVPPLKEWKLLAEVFKEQGKNPNPTVDPRNFLAHAGLEANMIEVRREDELYFRYTEKKVRYNNKSVPPTDAIAMIIEKAWGG